MKKIFEKIATWTSEISGSWGIFLTSLLIIAGWLILGPIMHFSDTWQLIISTISSAVTFLMVFLIQYAQNKDTKALHLKLDELIRSNKEARNSFVSIEEKPEEILDTEIEAFDKIAEGKQEDQERY